MSKPKHWAVGLTGLLATVTSIVLALAGFLTIGMIDTWHSSCRAVKEAARGRAFFTWSRLGALAS